MSRIGNKPIPVPAGVKIALNDGIVSVQGPKGALQFAPRSEISVKLDDDGKNIIVSRASDDRQPKALHGLTRAIISNMVVGVTAGYEKKLEIVGVGYVATLKGDTISMRVGYANEVVKTVPKELKVTVPDQTHIVVQGCDKQLVGQFAAELRSARKPEPYKGKGVRYQGEYIKLKPGKAASK